MLCVSDVSCNYDSLVAVDHVSFDILAGEKTVILGPNGCGKTTILKAITGLIEYTGTILFNGTDLKTIPRKEFAKKIAYMSQLSSVYFSYTVFETVILGRYSSFHTGPFAQYSKYDIDYANSCIDIVGMAKFRNKKITELSGGELQRVFLARAFAQDPDIIILDEPTNHLDLKYQIELVEYLNKWVSVGEKIVIGVLHDISLGLSFADKVILLSQGKIVSFDYSENLIKSNLLDSIYDIKVKDYMQNAYSIWNV